MSLPPDTRDRAADDRESVRASRRAGDWLGVYDRTTRAIREGRGSEDMRFHEALALANMEDTERALARFYEHGLERSRDSDKRAFAARLLKDQGRLGEAYDGYRAIFDRKRDGFTGINAASLALLSGRREEARALARRILRLKKVKAAATYYDAATRAEALVILGKSRDAREALARAVGLPDAGAGPQSSTLRQLAKVAPAAGIAPDDCRALLDLLRPRSAFHYAGHIFMSDEAEERRLAREIDAALKARKAGYAYGSIAAGADILVAEAVGRLGGELHIVLPCALPDFIAQSVRPASDEWIVRAERILKRATSVNYASKLDYVSDPGIFGYGAAVAMGLARLKAQQLATDSFQLAIWDRNAGGAVGTGADVRLWQAHGGETEIIEAGAIDRSYRRPRAAKAPPLPRRSAAILFTDYAGFSQLKESVFPAFDREIMGRCAAIFARHDDHVIGRNTWGDAVYAVLDSPDAGAEFAVDLQGALKEVDPALLGLDPGQGGMRIALHYGTVYESRDPVTDRANFLGREVARAARIEPVTPPGDVYVTEPFAAMIALYAPDRFRCRYVGQVDLAKKYGAFPMYRLTRVERGPGAG